MAMFWSCFCPIGKLVIIRFSVVTTFRGCQDFIFPIHQHDGSRENTIHELVGRTMWSDFQSVGASAFGDILLKAVYLLFHGFVSVYRDHIPIEDILSVYHFLHTSLSVMSTELH